MFYWAILTFICVFSLFFYRTRLGKLIIFTALLIFSLFRGNHVGTDTINYIDAVYDAKYYEFNIENSYSYEITYNSILKFINNNGLPARSIITFFSLYTFLLLFLICHKYKLNICLACIFFYLYFYISSFNEARQIAACMTIFLAYGYLIYEKKLWIFISLIIFASTIHLSSIIFLFIPLLLVLYDKISKQIWLFIMLLFLILFRILQFDFIEKILLLLNEINIRYVISYGDLFIENSDLYSIFGIIHFILEYLIIAYILKTNNPNSKKLNKMEFLFVCGYLFLCLMTPAHMYIKRISYGLSLFTFIFFADYYQKHLTYKKISFINVVFVFHILLKTYVLLSNISKNSNGVFPFEWIQL